ncbi:uncharacterized protein LOC129809810 isoform X3 [Phlebotomus papatasi]|uniref:uncharacterized protein LOC129809810 isoform X3 n=1 Tax=Phlebotomus papatasi TaxID=29031 RepID=UPI002483A503|nr:uncharacterized protein LOC129809810 isoform X3 [Phlebotomus papatasi]
MECQSDSNKLPPGWDEKYDPNSGLYFYINYITKTTTFDDPRIKHRQSVSTGTGTTNYGNSTESIPMQPLHGSPYHVYPANNYPAVQPAFQGPASGVPSHSASPLLAAKLQQMEMSPVTRPPTPRTNAHFSRNNIQETSFSNSAAETEAAVAKINTMFPTVSDTHIRLLLKKYYNREAVVISALQVEKHPITTPGPYSTPPPTNRHFHNTALGCAAIFQMTPPLNRDFSRTGSPILRPGSCTSGSYGSPRFGENFRSSPKPHSSPKMKLRYLKSIYPKAEETLLLDILANADNNVQKASEELTQMGYEKKDTTIPKVSMRKKDEAKNEIKNRIDRATPPQLPPKIKTMEEKSKLKLRLQSQYKDIPEKIISMALESVDYSEDRALAILNIVVQEDDKNAKVESAAATKVEKKVTEVQASSSAPRAVETQEEPEVSKKSDFKSLTSRTATAGPNSSLSKGPNDELLLVDYVTWNGANPDLATGRKQAALGSDPKNRSERSYVPKGANVELCKGPRPGLAKGSIYSQLTKGLPAGGASVICN